MFIPRTFHTRLLLAILSGLLYALAFPPLGWRWLVFPGIAGLLVALEGEKGTRGRALGFAHGLAAYGLGLVWLFQVFGALAVLLLFVLAVFTALFAEIHCRARARGIHGWHLALLTAVNWGGWEFIRAELFTLRFPWMTPGLALGPSHLLPWVGVYGAGMVAVFAACLLVMKRKWITGLAIACGLLFLKPAAHPTPAPADPAVVKAGGVQLEGVTLSEYLAATEKFPPDVRYVLWPEYAIPYDLRAHKRDWPAVLDLCRRKNITLTLGTQSRPGDGDKWQNIALTVDPQGEKGEHNKVHTVHLFDDGTPGTSALPVATRDGKVGTPVCFDCDYEGVVRGMTAAGAEFFMVPIMDAESWTARQHDQHAELFRVRACENGRWLFVCGTSGVSQIIDPAGMVHFVKRMHEPGSFTGLVKRETALTFYTRHGWLVPWITLGLAILLWISLLLPWRRRRGA